MKNMILSLMVAGLLIGCGGGSGTTSDVKLGTFVDAPVQGLKYVTATQKGFTDKDGHFNYKEGEKIEFSLGSMHFGGEFPAKSLMTPYDLAKEGDTGGPIFFAALIQSLDEVPHDPSRIVISEKIADIQMEGNFGIEEFVAEAEVLTGHSYTIVDFDDAKQNMDTAILAYESSNVAIGSNVDKIHTSTLKGYTVTIEEYDPIYKEIEFYCDGGYKLSTISPYTEDPEIKFEYHTPMMHIDENKLYLHYINEYVSFGDQTISDQYSVTLINNEIVVNDSVYNPGTYFEYPVTKITKIQNCN